MNQPFHGASRAASLPPPADRDEFARDLVAGLTANPKRISSKYFYDAVGSELFEHICLQPEYYVTRTETALLRERADEIAQLIGPNAELVEFGAGSLGKVRLLLDAMIDPVSYVPIDVSGEFLHDAADRLRAEYPDIDVRPVVADFTQAFDMPPRADGATKRIGFLPGSTIGNFDAERARAFLKSAARLLAPGALLIGVDLVKDVDILHAAYNDDAGVTAAFNKNLLVRANRELGSNFDVDKFDHEARFNAHDQRIEMYLVSRAPQQVTVDGQNISFARNEATHTEDSHKYTLESFRALAASAGFTPEAVWTDPQGLFSLHWLTVGEQPAA